MKKYPNLHQENEKRDFIIPPSIYLSYLDWLITLSDEEKKISSDDDFINAYMPNSDVLLHKFLDDCYYLGITQRGKYAKGKDINRITPTLKLLQSFKRKESLKEQKIKEKKAS